MKVRMILESTIRQTIVVEMDEANEIADSFITDGLLEIGSSFDKASTEYQHSELFISDLAGSSEIEVKQP